MKYYNNYYIDDNPWNQLNHEAPVQEVIMLEKVSCKNKRTAKKHEYRRLKGYH